MDLEILGRALSTLPADDDHPYRTGPWRPQTTEYRADDLEVIGDLPDDLDGVYIRNTENPVHPAQQGFYHRSTATAWCTSSDSGTGRRSTAIASSRRTVSSPSRRPAGPCGRVSPRSRTGRSDRTAGVPAAG